MPLRVMELNLNYHNGDLRSSGLSYRNKNPVAPEPRAQHSGAAVRMPGQGKPIRVATGVPLRVPLRVI